MLVRLHYWRTMSESSGWNCSLAFVYRILFERQLIKSLSWLWVWLLLNSIDLAALLSLLLQLVLNSLEVLLAGLLICGGVRGLLHLNWSVHRLLLKISSILQSFSWYLNVFVQVLQVVNYSLLLHILQKLLLLLHLWPSFVLLHYKFLQISISMSCLRLIL